jgi:adenylate cyclase
VAVISLDCWSESDQKAIREQLDRILHSGPFHQSHRRQRFLEYLVNETLAGRGERLKGYNIGLEVFDRPETFDPMVDPLVRIEAARLRDKLREYYEADGQNDPIRIDLPKGAYTPQIEFRAPTLDPRRSLPDKPSIAVLPFVNMSGDHAHDYLSDGITENIITGLSRFRDLSVIASYSAFSYKGKALRIQDVASELGVRFVLQGSVQKSSTRVTITAQLIDGLTGSHLWAERFDRGVEDIATVLDDLTEIIVARLATAYGGRLGKAWRGRAERTSPQNFQAYDYFCRGIDAFFLFTKGCTATAIQWFEKAIELDPSYGKPYAKIAWAHLVDVWLGWSEDTSFSMAEALKFATAAIQHDDDEAWGYWAMAGYHMFGGHHDRAISAYQRALELNPNDADVLNDFGQCLSFAGRATEGVEVVHKAMRLNPHYPDYWVMQLGPIYFDARRYEDAISTLEKLPSKDTSVQLYLAASHAALGHTDQARATIASVIRLDPLATLERLAPTLLAPYKNASDRDHLRENLVKAGLPE